MSESTGSTERTVVQTYVPAYQRETWDDHAERLDMNRSEFIRSMVQAGREVFEGPEPESIGESTHGNNQNEKPSGESAQPPARNQPTDDSFEQQVLAVLEKSGCLSWDELLAEITDDVETRLDDTLQELQANNEIQYSGREDGYVLADSDE